MAEELPNAYSLTFHIRYDECGATGVVRASVHLRLLQELAFAHSAILGFPLDWYVSHRLFWLVRRVNLVILAPAAYGDALVYTTHVVGARRVMARRLNTVRRANDSTTVAVALVDWIFTENGTTPVRIPDELKNAFPALGRPVAPVPLEEGRPPQDAAPIPVHIRTSDVDAMGHANNAVYVDLLDDAVARAEDAKIAETHPRTYDLQYSGAATAGAALRGVAWRDGNRRRYHLERPDGTLLLHGTLAAAQAPIAEARDVAI